MAYQDITPPEGGKITIESGKLTVPDNPVLPFIRGDGTGPDIWAASELVFDAAVVPHEVLPVVEGRRCYLGGFFSEERTVPRAWAFGRGGLGRRPAAVRE